MEKAFNNIVGIGENVIPLQHKLKFSKIWEKIGPWKHGGKRRQEGQYGPGSLTWIFEIINFFFSLSEKNLQEFVYVCTVQVAPIH